VHGKRELEQRRGHVWVRDADSGADSGADAGAHAVADTVADTSPDARAHAGPDVC
jgi:hypothetical protein